MGMASDLASEYSSKQDIDGNIHANNSLTVFGVDFILDFSHLLSDYEKSDYGDSNFQDKMLEELEYYPPSLKGMIRHFYDMDLDNYHTFSGERMNVETYSATLPDNVLTVETSEDISANLFYHLETVSGSGESSGASGKVAKWDSIGRKVFLIDSTGSWKKDGIIIGDESGVEHTQESVSLKLQYETLSEKYDIESEPI